MMQALEEMNGISPPANHHAPADVLATEGSTGDATVGPTHAQSTGVNNPNSEAGGGQPPRRMPSRPGDMLSLIFPPTLILQGDLPGGLRTLEVYIDHGQGMGPQIMPNHVRDYFLGPDLDRLIQMLSENDQNRYGTPPAAKTEVEKLPKLKITEEHLGSELAQCAVCKDDFELDSEVIQLPCNHIYHPDCILPWLAEHNSCPVCRFELPTDDADYEARKGQNRSEATGTNTEREVADHRNSENSGSGDSQNVNNIELTANGEAASRQFTLWGMPALGFDLNRSSSRPNSTSNGSNSPAQEESTVQSRRESIPMHWLFRLFSSGDLQTPEEAISGNGNSEQSNPGDSSAS
ncbi:hypothetical protein KP509_32G049400 [Ceratopteris richardii]|nr:hypothetical protein KP509_32G049400 [Ceratopteris richardii]